MGRGDGVSNRQPVRLAWPGARFAGGSGAAHAGVAACRRFWSSFRDWAAEETDHPREVIEAALAHVVQNRVEAAYRRTDLFERRRRLMNDWAAYLAGKH